MENRLDSTSPCFTRRPIYAKLAFRMFLCTQETGCGNEMKRVF